jgi:metal-responsive CopG/Arc/MetJ family transcriptional regulator
MTNVLSVRLDSETAHLLDAAARGKDRSHIVRQALRDYLMRRGAPPRPLEVVGDRVACADSGRSDLSERSSALVKDRLRAKHARAR